MWIRCKVKFDVSPLTDDQLEDLKIEPEYEWDNFAFDTTELSQINSHDEFTTLRFKNGDVFTSDLDFDYIFNILKQGYLYNLVQ